MIAVKDSGNNAVALKTTVVSGVHTPHHNVDVCALPTGAATNATLASVLAAVLAQATKAETQPVSIQSGGSADPATETTQTTVLARLTSILADLALKADKTESQPVTIAGAGSVALESTLTLVASRLLQIYNTSAISGSTVVAVADSGSGTLVISALIEDTSDDILVAADATHSIVPLMLTVGNSDSSVGTWVHLKDGASIIYSVYAPPRSTYQYDLGKYCSLTGTVNTDLNIACGTTSSETKVDLVYKLADIA